MRHLDSSEFDDDKIETSGHTYLWTGIFGVDIFVALFLCASISIFLGVKPKTEFFYYSTLVMCLLELPRYCAMIKDQDYRCLACYACHILASTVFFALFTYVCHHWSDLLKLSRTVEKVYSKKYLILSNIL